MHLKLCDCRSRGTGSHILKDSPTEIHLDSAHKWGVRFDNDGAYKVDASLLKRNYMNINDFNHRTVTSVISHESIHLAITKLTDYDTSRSLDDIQTLIRCLLDIDLLTYSF